MSKYRLVVVSNRLPNIRQPRSPDEKRALPVGGLVSVLRAAMEEGGGLWYGWSGNTTTQKTAEKPTVHQLGEVRAASIDLSEDEHNLFYTGFCNRVLWPLFHSYPSQIRIKEEEYRAYRRVNRRFADGLAPMLETGDVVWIHDYHLIPMADELRRHGWDGPIGFFLHTPFPPMDIVAILPWAAEMLEKLTLFDLVGFHTRRYAWNFVEALSAELGGAFDGEVYRRGSAVVKIGAYPIGTDPGQFEKWANTAEAARHGAKLRDNVHGRRLVLGVDRLDYTKGIPDRLKAFERMLERFPSWRGRVCLMQISVPSRTRVPEYLALRQELDQLVGCINGRFAEEDWLPVHHLYKSYSQERLAAIYREADVCLATSLRDGMNLVAKEFVASQTGDPGVLLLSRFCGAAEDLQEALIVNPYDIDGTAASLRRALEMSRGERERRWKALAHRVRVRNALAWRKQYVQDLTETHHVRPSTAPASIQGPW